MAKPRIFISSTFYDLKQVRSSLDAFVRGFGFDPVLSEKGSIAYTPDVPLDESCYREAKSCDVFVLIIGGRYGSEASEHATSKGKEFYERYESITRKEYESATERDIPIYVLIDKSVYSEYETFKRNRDNSTIKYAYVDSVNIFSLIDFVVSRPRNNPIFHFELSNEIESWLREQWAGLFREMIRNRTDRAQIASLADQVADLSNISTTLKRYLEELVSQSANKEQAKELIEEEHARLGDARELNEIAKLPAIKSLEQSGIPLDASREIFREATNLNDLARRITAAKEGNLTVAEFLSHWRQFPDVREQINQVRTALHLPPLNFPKKKAKKASQSGLKKVDAP
jgi:Domain of unknown function (DUF4062)